MHGISYCHGRRWWQLPPNQHSWFMWGTLAATASISCKVMKLGFVNPPWETSKAPDNVLLASIVLDLACVCRLYPRFPLRIWSTKTTLVFASMSYHDDMYMKSVAASISLRCHVV
jgi:hypothetical protein